jgi:hypothetical protein
MMRRIGHFRLNDLEKGSGSIRRVDKSNGGYEARIGNNGFCSLCACWNSVAVIGHGYRLASVSFNT